MEEKIVTLASFSFTRALFLKGRLEAEGIGCFISNINLIQPAVSTGVKIKVLESDLDSALKILGKIEKVYEEENINKLLGVVDLRKIIVPVDFSEYSVNAANFALDIAETLNAEIHLVHAYYNPVINIAPFFDAYSYQANMTPISDNFELQAKSQLAEFREKLEKAIKSSKKTGVKLTHSLIFGMPAETILDISDEYKPDLIIMGTKGKGDRVDDIIGSVTNKVIDNTNVPVLVIPEYFNYRLIDSMQSVAYITNFDESDYRAIWKLAGLISPFNLTLHCLHIGSEQENPWDRTRMSMLRSLIKKTFPGINLICDVIKNEKTTDAIQDYVSRKKINILSLTSHKKSLIFEVFYPSLFKKMLFQSTIPILVFPSIKQMGL